MQFRRQAAIGVAAAAAVVGSLVTATSAQAAAPAPVPTVVVHVNNHRVLVGSNNVIHAGRVLFKVVTGNGDHLINIARLRNGYTLPQFGNDVQNGFGGNTQAVRRVDRNVVFRGGAEARPNNPGAFSAELPAGRFLFLDQNTFKYAWVQVVGKAPSRQTVPNRSRIALFSYGFDPNMQSIPHQGFTLLTNKADQPHFIEFQRVKQGTTNAQVRRFFKNGAQGQPSWALRASEGSGVITQGQHSALWINLPRGEYVIACFWPDFRTGMPHALMGMWKLIQLT
jgi:hypothetical protein